MIWYNSMLKLTVTGSFANLVGLTFLSYDWSTSLTSLFCVDFHTVSAAEDISNYAAFRPGQAQSKKIGMHSAG